MTDYKKQRRAELARKRREAWNAEIMELRAKAEAREEEKKQQWIKEISPLLAVTRTQGFRDWYSNYSRFPFNEEILTDRTSAHFWWSHSSAFKALIREFSNLDEASEFFKDYKKAEKILEKAWERRVKRMRDATPLWFDRDKVKEMEKLRSQYNIQYPEDAPWHIDHIIPLQGETVCGLHIHTNMQLLPARVNWLKKNRFDNA